MPMERNILTVSQINDYIKRRLDSDALLQELCIRGEISNYKVYPSGHHYFTLKDSGGALRCVMFRGSASALRFRPENGMQVLALGRISVFPRDGAYQLYVNALMPEGVGDLHVAYEQLKEKLQAEGLFDQAHKKQIPAYPHTIAVITSIAGAAVHDMLRILRARYPLCKVLLLGVRVQGVEAPPEICGAIRYVNRFRLADLIITGRGGGSIEDLWAFNDERVAREIYNSEIPVISAVGHEPDVTISDFVADLRAATPSNAAELAVPDQTELRMLLGRFQAAMQQSAQKQVKLSRQRLNSAARARVLQSPTAYVQDRRLLLDHLTKGLSAAASASVSKKRQRFAALASGLDAMSPLKVLGRGYGMAMDETGGIVRSVRQLAPGQALTLRFSDGSAQATVNAVKEDEHGTVPKL